MKKHLAGIIPVSGIKSDFDMPWHASLMPIGPNYLAVERSVLECAYAGCSTIWIVCGDDVTPLIRYQVGEMIQDPVYNYRHFEYNKQDFKKPIRIYYVPIRIRDINKRDNLAWSAIHGAMISHKILSSLSGHLAPDKFWISWPYGYYSPSLIRGNRKDISENNVLLSWKKQNVSDDLYLGLTLNKIQIDQLVKESTTRSTGMWKDPEDRKHRHSLSERFSYRNFSLKKVFETLDFSNYICKEIDGYHCIDNWEDYCSFLASGKKIKRPSILKPAEWNEIGVDEE